MFHISHFTHYKMNHIIAIRTFVYMSAVRDPNTPLNKFYEIALNMYFNYTIMKYEPHTKITPQLLVICLFLTHSQVIVVVISQQYRWNYIFSSYVHISSCRPHGNNIRKKGNEWPLSLLICASRILQIDENTSNAIVIEYLSDTFLN